MGAGCSRKCCNLFLRDAGDGQDSRKLRLLVGEPKRISGTEVEFSATTVSTIRKQEERELDTDEESVESFHSFDEAAMDAAFLAMGCISVVRRCSILMESTPSKSPRSPRKRLKSSNSNHISKYIWLEEVLQLITSGGARDIARIEDTGQYATPLFVVAGACPNSMCGTQAVMYSSLGQSVEFWWIKPKASNKTSIERSTLSLHNQGKFKNCPGKAKAVYLPFAQKFAGCVDGDFSFGVDRETGRAFIDEVGERGRKTRMLLYFVWQETWSSMMAKKKFMKGKLFYQKKGNDQKFFARQYRIADSELIILEELTEEQVDTLLPPDPLQELFEMSD